MGLPVVLQILKCIKEEHAVLFQEAMCLHPGWQA
jgi:hypothetical protein